MFWKNNKNTFFWSWHKKTLISSRNFPVGLTKLFSWCPKKFWREKIDSIIACFRNCCRTSSKNVSDFWRAFLRQFCQNRNLCLQRSFLRENYFSRKLLCMVFGTWANISHRFSGSFRHACKNCNLRVERKVSREKFSSNCWLVSWISLHFGSKFSAFLL